ncbi:MAG TPA: hypothetical protein VHT34_01550, partial [Clostridia bacterium]|nr:hypothetical protein [Clostridia bacterium]
STVIIKHPSSPRKPIESLYPSLSSMPIEAALKVLANMASMGRPKSNVRIHYRLGYIAICLV